MRCDIPSDLSARGATGGPPQGGQSAQPHTGAPPGPGDLAGAWSFDPPILIGLLLLVWLYQRGVRALWARAGTGRGIRRHQVAAFAGGFSALAIALVSPLDAWGTALFSAHMAQHLTFMLIAAPLIVLGTPEVALVWALPAGRRRGRIGRPARRLAHLAGAGAVGAVGVWLLQTAALWVWHRPALYQAALADDRLHALEHLSFLASAALFWWIVVRAGSGGRLGYGATILFVFATLLQSGALGALMTFARAPWYPAYARSTAAWGLTPLEDQQIAGALMWVPAALVYVLTASLLVAAWLRDSERAERRREGRPTGGR